MNTCELCERPTSYKRNRYCETCANNVVISFGIRFPEINWREEAFIGWAKYHKNSGLGGEKQ